MAEVVKGRQITARAGEHVTVTAPRSGIGGYTWRVDIDPSVGHVVSQSTTAPKSTSEAFVGAGADAQFEIALTGKEGLLRLLLQRPWEQGPAKIVEHRLRVRR
jgi:predicted secreted protein